MHIIGPEVVNLWLKEYSSALAWDDFSPNFKYTFVNADYLINPSISRSPVENEDETELKKIQDFFEEIRLTLGVTR